MNYLRWSLGRLARPDARTLVRLALLIAAAVLLCEQFWLAPQRRELDRRNTAASVQKIPADAALDPLAAFYRPFRAAAPLAEQLARLDALARRLGLAPAGADYRLEAMPELALARYHIVLPVQAPYPLIKQFALQALAEFPALALDGIEVRRSHGGGLDARLRFVLYLPR